MSIYIKHNIHHVDPDLEDGQSLLFIGTPSPSTCPYYVYARMIADDAKKAFNRSKIKVSIHICSRRIHHLSHGTGPNFSVRLGDDMLPPDVLAVVATSDLEQAAGIWEAWQARRYFQRPVSVVGDLWYDVDSTNPVYGTRGLWRRGGTWTHVIDNAIAIARFLGRDTRRLETYKNRRNN